MCGIAGSIGTQPANWQNMRHALRHLSHRGPDGEGIAGIRFDGTVSTAEDNATRLLLGFRRLAIFDPSTRADQPMRCHATGNLLVFNGAVYNFLILREQLVACGHTFHSDSDTEVILAAYREWGDTAFHRFNGMWALALYDATRCELLLSRDRMGVKPLYYHQDGNALHFASEIRGLIQLRGSLPGIHPTMAFDFLAGVMTDHQEETLWESIRAVPAGALWRIAQDGSITRGHYHQWPHSTGEQQDAKALRHLLDDAVALRLRADAPSATLLSGGLDSAAITALAAEHAQDTRVQFGGAFSYGYSDAAYSSHDESIRAKALVAALPTAIRHTLLQNDPVASIPELMDLTVAQEQPFTTPSILASWRLYRAMHAHGIKVALSGEGADELFAGYTRLYLPLLARDWLRQGRFREAIALLGSSQLPLAGLLRRLAWQLPLPTLLPLLRWRRPHLASLHPTFWAEHKARFSHVLTQQALPLSMRLRQDVMQQGLPQILRYADRNSMASSIELRLPFLDYRLVAFALSTPIEQQIGAGGGKQLLRQAMQQHLPESVWRQPKTHGFGHAEQYQLHQLDLASLIERAPREAWDYLDRKALTAQWRRPTLHPTAWLPVSFLLWSTARAEGRFA